MNTDFKRSDFYGGAAFGLSIGSGIILVLLWMADGVPAEWFPQAASIFAVLATIFAAFIALKGVYEGIEANERAKILERKGKLEAAAATLPIVLSQAYNVAENRVTVLTDGWNFKPTESWIIEDSSIQVFRDCIEHSDGPVRKQLQEVLAAYQVCVSKFNLTDCELALDDATVSAYVKYQRYSQCTDWLSFKALVSKLFRFARTRQLPIGRDEVFSDTLSSLEWLNVRGWMLENDPLFKSYLASVSSQGRAGFSDPSWIYK